MLPRQLVPLTVLRPHLFHGLEGHQRGADPNQCSSKVPAHQQRMLCGDEHDGYGRLQTERQVITAGSCRGVDIGPCTGACTGSRIEDSRAVAGPFGANIERTKAATRVPKDDERRVPGEGGPGIEHAEVRGGNRGACVVLRPGPDMPRASGRETGSQWRSAPKLVLSNNQPRIKGHSVIPAPCTTRTQ